MKKGREKNEPAFPRTMIRKLTGKIVVLSDDCIPQPALTGKRQSAQDQAMPSWEDCADQFDDQEGQQHQQLALPQEILGRLYDHQRTGVNWMYHLHRNNLGGLLGDDMGMGKTFQVVSLLVGLMQAKQVARVLILAPVVVLPGWLRELSTLLCPHVPGAQVEVMNADVPKKKRLRILEQCFAYPPRGPCIVVSSHQLVTTMAADFAQGAWDYVILDEGHVIKNPSTKLSKGMHELAAHHRLLLTGTPIQNNLSEFWAIVDWATSGRCLGSIRQFNTTIADPILKGQHPKASDAQRQAATTAMKLLVRLVKPVLLQRKKKDYLEQAATAVPATPVPGRVLIHLPPKKELVVWISLSSQQKADYGLYLASTAARCAFSRDSYPVEVINTLKVLCRHPFLLQFAKMKKAAEAQSGKVAEGGNGRGVADDLDELDDVDVLAQGLSQLRMHHLPKADMACGKKKVESIYDLPEGMLNLRALMKGSVKLRLLLHMLNKMLEDGSHRVLVFSQSKIMLQLIQFVLAQHSYASYRIDGSTSYKDRQSIIDDFNCDSDSYSGPRVCLLTTKACGFGITLTGADRVIIFDPSWNPAEDSQAVDRAYRIGQLKPVLVYRFIHTGCIEQKIYEKQVFKEGLREVSEKGNETKRYFAGQNDLKELLRMDDEPAPGQGIFAQLQSRMDYLQEDGLLDSSSSGRDREHGDVLQLHGVMGVTRHDQLYPVTAELTRAPDVDQTFQNNHQDRLHRHLPSKPKLRKKPAVAQEPQQEQEREEVIDLTQSPALLPLAPPASFPTDLYAVVAPLSVVFQKRDEEEEEEWDDACLFTGAPRSQVLPRRASSELEEEKVDDGDCASDAGDDSDRGSDDDDPCMVWTAAAGAAEAKSLEVLPEDNEEDNECDKSVENTWCADNNEDIGENDEDTEAADTPEENEDLKYTEEGSDVEKDASCIMTMKREEEVELTDEQLEPQSAAGDEDGCVLAEDTEGCLGALLALTEPFHKSLQHVYGENDEGDGSEGEYEEMVQLVEMRSLASSERGHRQADECVIVSSTCSPAGEPNDDSAGFITARRRTKNKKVDRSSRELGQYSMPALFASPTCALICADASLEQDEVLSSEVVDEEFAALQASIGHLSFSSPLRPLRNITNTVAAGTVNSNGGKSAMKSAKKIPGAVKMKITATSAKKKKPAQHSRDSFLSHYCSEMASPDRTNDDFLAEAFNRQLQF